MKINIASPADVKSHAIAFSTMVIQTCMIEEGTIPPGYFNQDQESMGRAINSGWRVLNVSGGGGGPSSSSWAHWARVIESHELEEPDETKAVLGNLLEQVYQMQGMFEDSDGATEGAVREAEEAIL